MKRIDLTTLSLSNAELDTMLHEMHVAYKVLREAAERENELRTFLKADLMIMSLEQGKEMLIAWRSHQANSKQPYCYTHPPCICFVESSDTASDILQQRFTYVYNGAFA